MYVVLAYIGWRYNDPIVSISSGFFVLLLIWVLFLAGGTIDVDQRGIRVTAPYGVYELAWGEVESFDTKGRITYLYGNSKAVGYSLLFAGRGKHEFQRFIAQALHERRVPAAKPATTNGLTLGQMRRNAKVRGWKLL